MGFEGTRRMGEEDGKSSPPPLLGNRFQGNRCLIRHGRGETWQGMDLSTGQPVVLKLIPLEHTREGTLARLAGKISALNEVRSPWLSPPLYCDKEGGLLYQVMPHVLGETLAERLTRGRLSPEEALRLMRGVLAALRVAHERGVLHLGVKPSNIILTPGRPSPSVTLIHFGLTLRDLRELPLKDVPLADLPYLSPEQAGLLHVAESPASDLYSVGTVLFECLTGEPPFRGGTLGELLLQHLHTQPELRARGLLVPRAVEELVLSLLAKEPQDRYQSAEAALQDVDALASALERGEREPDLLIGLSDPRRMLGEPSFLERGREGRVLEDVLERTAQGRGGLVFIEGESGGGKTMLLDELARRGLCRRMPVLRGQGMDRSARQPFHSLRGVARDLCEAARTTPGLAESLRTRLEAHRAILCEAVPELEPVLGGTPGRDEGPEEFGASRMLTALMALFDALGEARRPALVLLDDCQWCGEQLCQVLAAWCRQEAPPGGRFVSLVVTFRTEAVEADHALRRMEPPVHLVMSPFEAPEVRRLVTLMARRLPEEVLELVVRLAEGNPFMATAVVHGLVESGALVPGSAGWRVEPQRLAETSPSVRATSFLLRRLATQPAPTYRLLRAGAILGRDFENGLAATLAGMTPDQACSALAEARRRHLLWGRGEHQHIFAHDRLRETMLAQLSEEETRALHGAAARELERRAPERTFDLSWHFNAAGEPARALPYALKAARQARHQHAPELAEQHYRIAARGTAAADRSTHRLIAEELGGVLLLQGRYAQADQSFQRALELARAATERALLEGRLSEARFMQGDTGGAITALRRALRQLGQPVPGNPLVLFLFVLWEVLVQVWHTCVPGRLHRQSTQDAQPVLLTMKLYNYLSHTYWLHGNQALGTLWATLRELNLAERYNSRPELASAYAFHGAMLLTLPRMSPRFTSLLVSLFFGRARRYFQRALDIRRASRDCWTLGHTLAIQGIALAYAARYAECVEVSREALELLQRAGDRWYTFKALVSLGFSLYMQGEWDEATKVGHRMDRLAQELNQPRMLSLSLQLLALATGGNIARERIAMEHQRRGATDKCSTALLNMAEGLRLWGAGMPEQAVGCFEQAFLLGNQVRQVVRLGARPWLATALRESALRVPPYEPARRATLLRRARAVIRQSLRQPGSFHTNDAHTLRERGWIAALEGHHRLARRSFVRSLAISELLGMKGESTRTLRAWNEVGSSLGWPKATAHEACGQAPPPPCPKSTAESEAPVHLSLVERFPCLLEAGRHLASALSQEAVFAVLRETGEKLLRAERLEVLELAALEQEEADPYLMGMRHALEAGHPVVLCPERLESLAGTGLRSVLCAPVLVRGQAVACVVATHRRLAGLFGEEEARIAQFLTTLAGAALENARGFAEVAALSEERQRLYQQAREALRKRDEFLAVASHELRTPLTPLKLQLQALLRGLRNPSVAMEPEQWAAKLELANSRVQRFARLVEDLFDLSRLEQGRLSARREKVDLSELAQGAAERWCEELMRVGCECAVLTPGPVVGSWDGPRLEQVLDNLLSNAMKYGPGRPIHISVETDGLRARLRVSDSGLGIALEDQARIFERFERAVSEDNYGGFGLGLWVCREVAHALGGSITVQSAPGVGATFTVELPLVPFE